MWFEDFQDGQQGGHLGYQNRKLSAFLNPYATPMPPTKFGILFTILEMWFEDFQDCGHLGYWYGMILAILNVHVPLMPLIKF